MTRTCQTCQKPFDYEPILFQGREFYVPNFCDPCITNMQAAYEGPKPEKPRPPTEAEVREQQWAKMCPEEYRFTDPLDPRLSRQVRDALTAYDPAKGRFLGLCGASGKGKTRLAFLRLQELHMAGMDVFFVSAKRLARAVQNQFRDGQEGEEAREVWRRSRESQMLLLDDLGKEKYTETVASELYDLVEWRMSWHKPMIWTANLGPRDLQERLGEERGGPTLRRLMEFSDLPNIS